VRFGGQVQTYEAGELELDIGDWVVVRQGESLRLGLVTTKPMIWPANQGKKEILLPEDRAILRLASSEDLTRQAENQIKEREDYAYCQNCLSHLGLSMKLVAVEITLDNYKTIFYYTAEERVDFRQLVRELVSRFRTRIEMRQIGVRLEALKLGGLGLCGRCFCCSSFLNNFCQVSVKMAKEQNLSLNTAKISGVCGRLMCCLSYENYPFGFRPPLAKEGVGLALGGQRTQDLDEKALADLEALEAFEHQSGDEEEGDKPTFALAAPAEEPTRLTEEILAAASLLAAPGEKAAVRSAPKGAESLEVVAAPPEVAPIRAALTNLAADLGHEANDALKVERIGEIIDLKVAAAEPESRGEDQLKATLESWVDLAFPMGEESSGDDFSDGFNDDCSEENLGYDPDF
jgi:cell fate regulator YaaT (PSP1 superfamily)